MDVDSVFNIFLNNYLRIVYTSFPLRKMIGRDERRQWITTGIKTSCNRKRYIEEIKKFSSACNMIRDIKPPMSINTLRNVYHSYFHSVDTWLDLLG
jgi:hypothetical protein